MKQYCSSFKVPFNAASSRNYRVMRVGQMAACSGKSQRPQNKQDLFSITCSFLCSFISSSNGCRENATNSLRCSTKFYAL